MVSVAQINQFQPRPASVRSGAGMVSGLLQRMMLACEVRAIYRLEIEASHLLEPGHIAALKADLAARRAQAGL